RVRRLDSRRGISPRTSNGIAGGCSRGGTQPDRELPYFGPRHCSAPASGDDGRARYGRNGARRPSPWHEPRTQLGRLRLLLHLVLRRGALAHIIVDDGHGLAIGRNRHSIDVDHLAVASVGFFDRVVRDALERNPGLARIVGGEDHLAIELGIVALSV